jgi:hypothetical protein
VLRLEVVELVLRFVKCRSGISFRESEQTALLRVSIDTIGALIPTNRVIGSFGFMESLGVDDAKSGLDLVSVSSDSTGSRRGLAAIQGTKSE